MPDWNDDDEGWDGDSDSSDGDGYEWESNATETTEVSPSDRPDEGTDIRQLLKTVGVSGGLGLGGFALGIIASLPLMFAVIVGFGLPFDETAAGENIPGFVTNTIALQGIGMGGISAWYLSRYNLGFDFLRLRNPTVRHLGWIVAGTIGLFVLNITIGVLFDLLGQAPADHEIVDRAIETPELLLVGIVLTLLVIAPAEELLFRGIIQTNLVDVSDTWIGVLLASFVFAIIHLPAYGGLDGWTAIISLFFLGIVLGLLYERTDNLWVPIMAHGLYNASLFVLLYVAIITGQIDQIAAVLPV